MKAQVQQPGQPRALRPLGRLRVLALEREDRHHQARRALLPSKRDWA